ncbi:MAG: hypothetical protein GKR94_26175 [Gammaproteobacteria bacterium]|nr:hypothetical protein [Gammaproteobacteria bacterium]
MTSLDRYRLSGSNNGLLRIHNRYWDCAGLFLSNTCLAVHPRPRSPGAQEADEREALRTLLRGLGQRLLEFNLWRPVVAVLEVKEDRDGRYTAWAADQDWHRGDFLLFVEQAENVEKRLDDLLDPGHTLAKLQPAPREPRTDEWYRSQLDELTADHGALRSLLDSILPVSSTGAARQAAGKEAIQQGFDDWCKKRIEEADQITVEGGRK